MAASLPYSPGLEGVIAGESAICCVDPAAGLLYAGYNIEQLARMVGFETVAWLLLHGELPQRAQLASFHEELVVESWLPEPVNQMLRLLPPETPPVDVLRTGTSMLAAFDEDARDNSHEANLRKSVRILAKMSSIVTTFWNVSRGLETIYEPESGLSHAGRFLGNLLGHAPQPWQTAALDVMLNLYAEHEFNASTFSARVTASTLADLHAAITSAIGTLKGPLHGGANEEATRMLREIGSAQSVENWLAPRLAYKQKIMGFGHRVYKKGDSRVPVARSLARELAARCGQQNWIDICEKLEEVMAREKNLFANLDLYAAPVLHMIGIPAELNICVFACARVAGWCAHVIEQHDHNRLIRPRCLYTGPEARTFSGISSTGEDDDGASRPGEVLGTSARKSEIQLNPELEPQTDEPAERDWLKREIGGRG